MHSTPFLIDCLLNDNIQVSALVDSGCLCYSVFDADLVRTHNFLTKDIKPRVLHLANGNTTEYITKIACVIMTVEGIKQTICGYVVPKLAYSLILGKPWMEQCDITYVAKEKFLLLKNKKDKIKIKESGRLPQHKVSTNFILGVASTTDIAKALESKPVVSREEIIRSLPFEIRQFCDLFMDDDSTSNQSLPPHRIGVDTKIVLLKDETGKEKEVPWGPLYRMSQDELLVLRHTLTDLLSKKWIRPSNSSGGAPVLFVKKPSGGLRFCVDYRGLNTITKRDRYPLPLVNETLRLLAKATWISKVDVRAAFHRLRIAEGDEWKTASEHGTGLLNGW